MASNIRRGRSVVSDLQAHLVFITKYRRKVISKRVLRRLREIFDSVCCHFDATLLECDGERDHVHLLVAYPPKYPVSKLVNSLKLVSSRLIRKEGFHEVEANLYGKHFWSPSYYAGSCGGANLQTVAKYIQNQSSP